MSNRVINKTLIVTGLIIASLLATNVWAKSSVWKVSKDGEYIYIGGTVHILPPSEFPLPKEFEQAYKDSDSIVLEAQLPDSNDLGAQIKMMQQMSYSNGKNISNFISKNTYQQLKQYVASLGTDLAMLQQFKPGFLVTMLTVLEVQRAGLAGEGVDVFYSKKAMQDNKAIAYFETAEFQMNMIANMGIGHENKFIESNLKQMKNFKGMFTGLLSAWRSGNSQQLNNLAIKPMQEDPKTLKTMLLDRNKNWVKDINTMFVNKEREFVLVGVAHLVGNDSVLSLLKGQGYRVVQI
ncbi:TraB/GumN family protein [Colwellia sp. E2M01]|uniref:TraB/GumN family protein n=1 Tax=Colwellia sp. E2M01 TaxID=2841561 RepID=UPI001C09AC12|nr:TraB/GumN family protein [Colwellia sp. E2M01]MBU2871030.1 TraB/GumN family protein [Colwellia sp. E2M01]